MMSQQTQKVMIHFVTAVVLGLTACAGSNPPEDEPAKSEAKEVESDSFETVDVHRGYDREPFRYVSIEDLEDVKSPSGEIPSTTLLARRSDSDDRIVDDQIRIVTRCGDNYCVDGLVLGTRTLVEAQLSEENSHVRTDDSAWLERVIRVASNHDDFISIHVAISEFSGGAHTNDILECRTYGRHGEGRLRLGDVMGKSEADKVLEEARNVLEPESALETFGTYVDTTGGFEFSDGQFVVDESTSSEDAIPGLRLCAQGSYPGESHRVLELAVDVLPRVEQ